MTSLKEIFLKYELPFDDSWEKSLQSVTNNLQHAKSEQIVFYHLRDTERALLNFKNRLGEAQSQCVFITGSTFDDSSEKRVIHLEQEKAKRLEEEIVEYFFPYPKNLKLIGITGTNGKTSSAWMVGQILKQWNKKGLIVGTLGVLNQDGELKESLGLTTPSFSDLRRLMHSYKDDIDFMVMEVSSHGLEQERVKSLRFDVAGWTNFTQDHLDYHGSLEGYFKSKAKILNYLKEDAPVYIPVGQTQLFQKLEAKNKKTTTSFQKINKEGESSFLSVAFNQDNFEIAYELSSFCFDESCDVDLEKVSPPPGRFEIHHCKGRFALIDYAHTPDALEKLLLASKELKKKKIWVVFGCGGDRDRAKRKIMGEVAKKFADYQVITSDNPRTEDPFRIIEDIKEGCPDPTATIENRKEAIIYALNEASDGELIVIAGKGHENYQDINGKKLYFSDQDEVKAWQ